MNKIVMRVAIGAVIVAGLAALLIWGYRKGHEAIEKEKANDAAVKQPERVEMDKDGNEAIIRLDDAAMSRVHIGAVTLTAATLAPSAVAYGRLEVDPSRNYVLRAPFAGVLASSNGYSWPGLGEQVGEGAHVGALTPRLAALDRVNLATQLATARADAASAEASLIAARAALIRAEKLNEDKTVADRALEDARATVRSGEARLSGAQESVRVIESALSGTTQSAVPLVAERAGQVVEIFAQPGEAIESGQPILRLASFDRLIARVEVPLGTHVDGRVANARVVAVGREGTPLGAEAIARTGAIDPTSQAETFLLRVSPGEVPLRPGAAVTAWIDLPGPPLAGVVLPRDAIVRTSGKAWAYACVGIDEGTFSRRQVALEHAVPEGWFVESGKGFEPGDKIVSSGAGTLLSEELRPTIDMGD